MFMFHRRFHQLNNLYLVVSFLLATGFIIQLKVLYHSHQKHLRLTDYNARLNELSNNMNSVMRVANTTSELMKRLQTSSRIKRLRKHITVS